ncbi:Mur ligase family, glutamate ligase domain protein [Halobacteriovorax sp. BALOs_7]|uniref:Mur ligase family protein n=1 Tax=Halobacteriovorax sp. BALOs_7 TaxID=2109558 RepID=UPI000EB6E530|nr:UDP-N-acetylmuramoyl-L-alanyl-D-glutamate--2,6-diaminopimelate ligase [Halobacteriovorax sp. BALOs_7]AYF43111.1 Mur ligase family, glutamate ligase domain protein [Halobacteriovorax sp. BALOs_7]
MNSLISKYNIVTDQFVDLTVNLDQAKKGDIAFYRLYENEKSISLFKQRYEKGNAGLVITNLEVEGLDCLVVELEDFYQLQEELVEVLYPLDREVSLIGVTGTNGKSSVTHLCQLILNRNNFKACCIGTVGIIREDKEIMPSLSATTPSYLDLRRVIYRLNDIDYFCIEVSSHALEQGRVKGMDFSSIGWTNLTQDHLDYHGTMEAYFNAKAKLLNYCENEVIIPSSQAEYFKDKIKYKVAPHVDNKYGEEFNLSYNKDNLDLAFALCDEAAGEELKREIKLELPKGRFNLIRDQENIYIIDYAHTPDALINICRETKSLFKNHHLITIFGCGGDRDRTKRPLMLQAALEYSDSVVVTSDNPRFEDPERIIEDILKDNSNDVDVIVSREDAIKNYVKRYKDPTAVIIAGKGHEEYQDVNGVKSFFSDIEIVKKAIEVL